MFAADCLWFVGCVWCYLLFGFWLVCFCWELVWYCLFYDDLVVIGVVCLFCRLVIVMLRVICLFCYWCVGLLWWFGWWLCLLMIVWFAVICLCLTVAFDVNVVWCLFVIWLWFGFDSLFVVTNSVVVDLLFLVFMIWCVILFTFWCFGLILVGLIVYCSVF